MRDDVDADELADAAGGGGAGVGRGFHRSDIASDDRGHQAGIDFLPADEHDVGRLHHRVGGFNHPDEPARLDHAERVAYVTFRLVVGHELLDSTSRRDRQRVNHAVAVDEPYRVDEIRDDTRMVRDDVDAI